MILLNLVRDRIRQFERAQRALAVLSNRLRGRTNRDDRSADDSDLVGYLLRETELSPPQNQVIRMVYLGGKTITDVARELGKNPGTIQRHHDRALEKLASRAAHLRLSE
jgi:RNA polymerase sigma factor (sigma-70 family)